MSVGVKELLEAGVHFGHRLRNWNPKMAPFIYGARNDLHIIDLRKTQIALNKAIDVVSGVAAQGGNVIFVGTKFSAQALVAEQANKCGMPYVNRRWLGGMLTNYKTIKQSVKRLKDIEYKVEHADLSSITKKERLKMHRELDKLNASLGGIKEMKTLPDLIIVIDVQQEKIAISEAKKLGIPVVGIVDTNSDPDNIDYVVPGNDDSMKAIKLYLEHFSKAIFDAQEGLRSLAEQSSTIVMKSAKDSKEEVVKKTKVGSEAKKVAGKQVKKTEVKEEVKVAAKKQVAKTDKESVDNIKKAKEPAKKSATKKSVAKPAVKKAAAKKSEDGAVKEKKASVKKVATKAKKSETKTETKTNE